MNDIGAVWIGFVAISGIMYGVLSAYNPPADGQVYDFTKKYQGHPLKSEFAVTGPDGKILGIVRNRPGTYETRFVPESNALTAGWVAQKSFKAPENMVFFQIPSKEGKGADRIIAFDLTNPETPKYADFEAGGQSGGFSMVSFSSSANLTVQNLLPVAKEVYAKAKQNGVEWVRNNEAFKAQCLAMIPDDLKNAAHKWEIWGNTFGTRDDATIEKARIGLGGTCEKAFDPNREPETAQMDVSGLRLER